MAAFNFPDPTVQQTVTNPITGSTYQWKSPPGKWIVTSKVRSVSDIISEGVTPPIPRGDYKLWYSTDTLELYFWYEDINGNGAWVPTAAPITMLEDLDNSVFELRQDLTAANVAINENTNRIASIVSFSETPPTIYPDENSEQSDLNYKFWLNTLTNELSILRIDGSAPNGYSYQLVSGGADIFYGDVPPTADDGNYLLWWDTDRLELYILHEGMWFPANPSGGGGGGTGEAQGLDSVLSTGNVATKSIFLTDGASDAIALSLEEARLSIAAAPTQTPFGTRVPRIGLSYIGSGNGSANSNVEMEIDGDGKRVDIECDQHIEEMHFRFEEDEKFILNKVGDAEFIGRVKAAPGQEENELVTYGQLSVVEEEIEQIKPTLERGVWSFTDLGAPELEVEEFKGLFRLADGILTGEDQQNQCNLDYNICVSNAPDNAAIVECNRLLVECDDAIQDDGKLNLVSKWEDAKELYISAFDAGDVKHTFTDVEAGQYIDFFNVNDDGFMVAKITKVFPIGYDPAYPAYIVMQIEPASFRGSPRGEALVKIFNQIQVQEQGDIDALLALDDFTATYENFGYINTRRADFDFYGHGDFTLEMGDGDKDNYWYGQWVNKDKNGDTINWIDGAEPGQKLNIGDHLRIYQPSTGGVVIFKVDDYSSVWAPSYVLPRSNSNEWLVNRGRFVFGEPVVIQVGVYTEPAIQGGSTLGDEMTNWPELPKFWKWKYTEGANTVPSEGFSIDRDITMNAAEPLLISLKGRDGQVIKGPSATRTFGEGSTVICYEISGGEHRIMWSAVLQQITLRKDQGWMECYISKRSNQTYMTNNNLYMLKLSAFGN